MPILYVITILALFITWILIKKSDKKLNVLTWIAISLVIVLGYNVVVCYLLNLFNLPINLLSLSIINIIVIILECTIIIKEKQIQQYEFKILDLLCFALIAIVCLIISSINYGGLDKLNLKYQTTDPALHYKLAVEFKESNSLNRNKDDIYVSMPAAYVNSGIAMKIFNYDNINSYKIFISYDIFIFILTAISMYVIMNELNTKSTKLLKLIALLFSILYVLGYPLVSMIFGFSYLTIVLPVINVIIYLFEIYNEEKIKLKYWILIVTILNFLVFFSYYLFVPFVYGAEIIYLNIENYKKERKILSKKNILILLTILVVPIIISLQYFNFLKQITNSGKDIANAISIQGYIYTNKYSDFILLIPLAIFTIIKERKNIKFCTYIFVLTFLYIVALYIAKEFGLVTMYYILKNYFVLWGILYIMAYKTMIYLNEIHENVLLAGIIIYIFLLVNLSGPSVVYYSNYTVIGNIREDAKYIFTKDEIDFLIDIKNIVGENTELIGNQKQRMWSSYFLEYSSCIEERNITDTEVQQNKDTYQYLIILKRNENTENLIQDKIVLFENEQGYVIQNY